MSDNEIESNKPFYVGLSDAELERLALLLEECGEVQQIIGKILRHGYWNHHPHGGPNNRELLEIEVAHVKATVAMMVDAGDLDIHAIGYSTANKQVSVGKWLHFQGERGHISKKSNETPNAEM